MTRHPIEVTAPSAIASSLWRTTALAGCGFVVSALRMRSVVKQTAIGAMGQVFYIAGGDDDIRECRGSLQKRQQMTINGLTDHRQVEAFTGIVQSIEYLRHNPPDMCWRVTMRAALLQVDIASTKSFGPEQLNAENTGKPTKEETLTAALQTLTRLCVITGAIAVFAVLTTTAQAAHCLNALEKEGRLSALCSSVPFSAYAQYDDDDDDDEEDDEEGDEDDSRDFVYDEDEGSLLVDLENCEPGKYWMMDFEDGVPLPCR